MSVWDIPHHLDDALLHALDRVAKDPLPSHLLRSLADFTVTHVDGFETRLRDGLAYDSLPTRMNQLRSLYEAAGSRHQRAWDYTIAHYEAEAPVIKHGLRAVYDICVAAYRKEFDEPSEIDFKEVSKFMGMVCRNAYTAGHSAQHTSNQVSKLAHSLLRKHDLAAYLFQAARVLDHTLSFSNAPGYVDICELAARRKQPAPYTHLADEARGLHLGARHLVRIVNGTILIEVYEDKLTFKQKAWHLLYLTPKDIKRTCETLNGIAQTLIYPRLVTMYEPEYDRGKVIQRVLDHIIASMADCPDAGQVARFYDVGLHTLVATWGKDMDQRPLLKMKAKFQEENLSVVGDMNEYLRILRTSDKQTALDAARVYKLLPCPDFDPYVDFATQAGKQANKNKWFHNCAEDVSEEEFENWRNLQACRLAVSSRDAVGAVSIDIDAAIEAVGSKMVMDTADAILAHDDRSLPLAMAPYMDFTGLLPMVELDAIVPDTLKDKSLCPANVQGMAGDEIDASGDRWSSNYLLEHIRTSRPATADECLTRVARTTVPYYHKVFFKPETKKAHARNCYSAQSVCRKALSKVELSVAEYLRLRRGNANGIPDYEVTNDVLEAIQGRDGRYLAISFDISGWSPNMALQATRSSLRKWARLFGDDRVADAHKVLTNGIAVWNHGFIKQSYALNGTDLEGYFGRLNTDYHIDVMTYALHVLSRRMRASEDPVINEWSSFSANLQVMIDDGLLILTWDPPVPLVEAMPARVFDMISNTIEEVYGYCSLKLSWDKTIISGVCMTFLNEVYFNGEHIGNGLRSYIRIRPDRDAIPGDYHERVHRYTAMAQGALKAGAPMIAVVIAMSLQLGMEFDKTKKLPKGWGSPLGSMLFLPTAYSGANMPSITLLGASAGGDSFAVSIGNCQRIAAADAYFKGRLVRQLRHSPVPATPLQTLRDATSVHTTAPRITSSALRQAIATQLPRITKNVEIRALLRLDLHLEAVTILGTLGAMATPEAAHRAYSGSRVHLVDRLLDKFKKANSLAGVLPKKKLRQIEQAAVRSLALSLDEYMRKF